MNLGEAIAKREHGEVITRNGHTFILPTDDTDNRMIVMFKQSNSDWKVVRKWNPQCEDFDSDMWKIERLEDVIIENTEELQDVIVENTDELQEKETKTDNIEGLSLVKAIKLLNTYPNCHAFSNDFNESTKIFRDGEDIYYLNNHGKRFAPTQLDFSKDWDIEF